MFPMDRIPEPVTVEYDCRGQRVRKTFPNAYVARRFWASKDRDGKRPTIVCEPKNAVN